MTRELIDDMREVILPFVKEVLLKTNYEGLGKSDAKVFERDFNEILHLAIKALEQEPTTQERQAENDKFDAAFQDGYNNGYAQARFDYEQEPTTKNDLIDCEHTDCNNCVNHKYCDYETTTKNDLGVDCISRQAVRKILVEAKELGSWDDSSQINRLDAIDNVDMLPSVTPQEPQTFKWCTDCREYDQEKHCCHRWSKVIRDTVEEMKQEQEPIKPMVEIDLYSVIKQKYIEREVLDKIRAEIIDKYMTATGEVNTVAKGCLQILDKYKAGEEE